MLEVNGLMFANNRRFEKHSQVPLPPPWIMARPCMITAEE